MAGQTLTITQMYALARQAGLPPDKAVIAAAIGMAESSGRTAVTSANPDGGTNVGIWQIDTKAWPYTVAQLQDPSTNAKAMAQASKDGSTWAPWETYDTGAYSKYLSQASAAQSSESGSASTSDWLKGILAGIEAAPGIGSAVAGAVQAAGQLLQLPSQVTDFLTAMEKPVQGLMWFIDPGHWARIIAGIFGFLLLGAGLVTLGLAA